MIVKNSLSGSVDVSLNRVYSASAGQSWPTELRPRAPSGGRMPALPHWSGHRGHDDTTRLLVAYFLRPRPSCLASLLEHAEAERRASTIAAERVTIAQLLR